MIELNKKKCTQLLLLMSSLFAFIHVQAQTNFFSKVTYCGAAGNSDFTANWSNWNPRNTSYPSSNVTVTGSITSNTKWTANKVYLLKGYVYVKNNATLTIEPGTIIKGDVNTTGTLVVTRGAKIIANGTANNPIVFTSSEAAGARSYGDWGGLLILGKAKINTVGGSADVGAGINNASGDGLFGGTDDNDSSGVLRYIRIEFAGIQYQPDKEINGLTLAGVGSRTRLEYIMNSFCGNDAFRFSGGAVRGKYLVSNKTFDSDFTFDLGFRGSIQFGLVLRDSTKANALGNSSIEVQNDALSTNAQPFTFPILSNFTLIGPLTHINSVPSNGYRYGIHLRKNAQFALFNSAISGYAKNIVLDGSSVGRNMKSTPFPIENVHFSAYKNKNQDTLGGFALQYSDFDFDSWLIEPNKGNTISPQFGYNKYVDSRSYNNPIFILQASSPLLNCAKFTHPLISATLSIGKTKTPHQWAYLFTSNQKKYIQFHTVFDNFNVEIFNTNGKCIWKNSVYQHTILLPDLVSGMYLLKIQKGNELQTLKLIY